MIKDIDNFILLSAPSSYQFLVALFAVLAVGGAAVLLPLGIAPEEINVIAQKCNARAFAIAPDYQAAAKATKTSAKLTSGTEILPIPITLGDNGSSADIRIITENNIRFSADRPALVQFTSGTTGSPKGVVHARTFFYHQVEVYFGCPMSEINGLQPLLGPDAVYLSYRSFHWGGGIRNATAAILAGVCTEIYNHDATPGAMWTQMKAYYEECLANLPQPMLEEYLNGARGLQLAKSDSNLLTPSVKRADHLYIGEPEATRAAFDRECFYKTGDLGHFDVIVFDGRRVPIIDVEESLMALPYVMEAYVLGIPDAEVMNRTAVLLRVKEGKCLTLQALRTEMAGRLAKHKLPTLLRKLDASEGVPKTHSGKFDMRKARSVFFPQSVEGDISDLPPEVEVWKLR
ncbi:hypothetical protein Asppvi_011424 [Aspergillus pseudoviridinutans]|uniref:AMP-dependent synthetase/ligase domain-containing protein n=1 Tax=Aspergillus pseudoviridinutans TaxID=1517512 RepID=A0A9P3BJU6_9EURO|nr:uncharacterized protein Asppvi_011424 [Aspergillus pseudoviridinutans]GIJ92442.1 hypothetical protein Asppvi_011424 [Aspergillus pseudoviridinutans]